MFTWIAHRICHKDFVTKILSQRLGLCHKDFGTNKLSQTLSQRLCHKLCLTNTLSHTLSQRVCHNDDLKDDTYIIDQILKLESIVMFNFFFKVIMIGAYPGSYFH